MYFPSSQIKTNLYTNGNELVYKSNNQKYIGFYWKTSSEEYYTGKTPQDINIQELILLTEPSTDNVSRIETNSNPNYGGVYLNPSSNLYNEYDGQKLGLDKINSIPVSFNPQPTQSDYDLGEFTRYFCKKTNELYYVEINEDTYTKLISKDPNYLWQLYIPFKYQWIISGEEKQTYTTNKNVTNYMIVKFNFPALNQFLKEDYLKFWKPK